jgi:Xaa-Pro aminopeptidase
MQASDWSREEIQGRWRRTQARMVEAGLDGLLVGDPANFKYLSGQTSPQFLHRMRPQLFLLPQHGDPAMYIYGNEVKRIKEPSFVTNVRTYVDVPPFPVEDLAKLIRELGWESGHIGVELGVNQRMGFPLTDYFALQKALPKARWEDASSVLIAAATAKSPAEVDAMRESCRIAQAAWELLLTRIHPGASTAEVARDLAIATIELGSDPRFGVPSHVTQLSTGTKDGILRQGDILKCDYHSCYRLQWSDICRLAVVGEPTKRHKELHAQSFKMLTECLAQLRPGRRAREIAEFNNQQRKALGVPLLVANKRMGHGVGVEATTPPSLNIVDETILVPGTVLAVEPSFESEFGAITQEECAVITEDGYAMLSSGAETLGVIR